MLPLTPTELGRRVKRAEEKTPLNDRLKIGSRLIACFGFIIAFMLVGDAVIFWQFDIVRTHTERLSSIDQKLTALLRVHASLVVFHDRLEALAQSEDADQLAKEAGPLRAVVLEDTQRARSALSLLPSDLQQDATIMPTLLTVQSAFPAEVDAITSLASAGDWRAVRLRLTNQIQPLVSLTSALVEKVDSAANEERAETVKNVRRVQRRVFLIVPITAIFTLLLAGTLGLAITRSITRPLERLVEGSKALARGEFQHRVAISGEDELAHLGQVFNDTVRQLQDLYATLRNSEDRLQRVIDTIPAHVWSARADGTVDFINQRWVESAGLSLEKGVGWDWSSILHPEDRARFMQEWQTALAAGEPMESEARLARTDGKYGWWLIRIVPLRDNQGKVLNWYGVATDIEDRKRAEEEREKLRQLEADLAHVNRVSMMGELAASLAHEIRQPIAATITNAQTCLRWLKRDQPDLDEVREAASRIVKDGTRAADIISHMRSLYKKSAPQRELVNLNQIIRELLVLLRGEATRYSISMRTELASNLPEIIGDPVQLQQVFINLMLNAIEAMKDTRGELIIKSQLDQNGKVLITVSDTGVGFAE